MQTLTKLVAATALATGLSWAALPVQATGDGATDRPIQRNADENQESYLDRARKEMGEWKDRIAELGRDAKREGKEMSEQAAETLDGAWNEVSRKWEALEDAGKEAGAEGWQKAKDAYEASKRTLQEAWEDVKS